MNDRFKFRAWDIIVQRFQYFDFKELAKMNYKNIQWHILKFQQCTGLKDKNGKLIYEGDVVRYLYYICEIAYKRGGFILEVRKGKKDGFFHFYDMHNSFLDVIGNIYENPELLKECE